MNIPRPEYPRPQMTRDTWQNLNGEWEFEFDFTKSGKERELFNASKLERTITVPFCPESRLSGIGYTDFIPAVWYKRSFSLTESDMNGRTLLHFGAVDYFCEVWINGKSAGSHRGGYTAFSFEITDFVHEGENTVVVYAEDDVRSKKQPRGKQSAKLRSHDCDYTRTTGIWQTVWLETVPDTYIADYKIIPDYRNGKISITAKIHGNTDNLTLSAEAFLKGESVGKAKAFASSSVATELNLSKAELWEPKNPVLYDITLSLTDKNGAGDSVKGYFGLRGVEARDGAILINGKKIYQRLVLDQGFYPDGIYTAPSDEALKEDITRCIELGFNGARLHQKVFEPRFLYWADHLGYLCWGEYASWGIDITKSEALGVFLPEWTEALNRDFNHPAIIGWCPFNETNVGFDDEVSKETVRRVYEVTKLLDETRPVIDTSGYVHTGKTDVYDLHDYEQNADILKAHYESAADGKTFAPFKNQIPWDGKTPLFISEYGGTWWNPDVINGWGYGESAKSEEEVCDRYCGLTRVLMDNPKICAFCYTQPYDIEQEQNGLFKYDRSPKFSEEIYRRIKATNERIAAIEK